MLLLHVTRVTSCAVACFGRVASRRGAYKIAKILEIFIFRGKLESTVIYCLLISFLPLARQYLDVRRSPFIPTKIHNQIG